MDHPGPMANSVTDVATLLQAIAEPDTLDPLRATAPVPDFVAPLTAVSPPRLGRLRGFFAERADAAMTAHVDQMATALRGRGAEIVDVALPSTFAEVIERHRVVMAVEAAQFHELRLRRHPEDYDPNITTLLKE